MYWVGFPAVVLESGEPNCSLLDKTTSLKLYQEDGRL